MSFEIVGTLLAAGIQGLMLSIVGSSTSCKVTLGGVAKPTDPTFLNATRLFDFEAPANATGKDKLVSVFIHPKKKLIFHLYFFLKKEGYLVSAGIMSAIYILCCLTTFFGTKEMKGI